MEQQEKKKVQTPLPSWAEHLVKSGTIGVALVIVWFVMIVPMHDALGEFKTDIRSDLKDIKTEVGDLKQTLNSVTSKQLTKLEAQVAHNTAQLNKGERFTKTDGHELKTNVLAEVDRRVANYMDAKVSPAIVNRRLDDLEAHNKELKNEIEKLHKEINRLINGRIQKGD